MIKKINNYILENDIRLITILLFLQPFIDVFTAISMKVFHHSFILGLVIRNITLLIMIYYIAISDTKHKRKIFIYFGCLLVYFLLFSFDILYSKGINAFFYEFKQLIKVFSFPIMLLFFYTVLVDKNKKIDSKIIYKLFIIYVLFVLVPNLFNIGFNAYEITKSGSIGFFYTANEIGAIISILMPVFFFHLFAKKNKYINILSLIIILYLLLSIGTKAPLLLFSILMIYYVFNYYREKINNKEYQKVGILTTIIIIVVSVVVISLPKTNFYKNIKVHLEFLNVEKFSDIYKNKKVIDHFIFSQRLTFWDKTNNIYKKSSALEKIFGIGYINNYSEDNISMKMVEMDFVDIFYRHGIIGFLIYMLPLVFIVFNMIKLKTNHKKNNNKILNVYLFSIIFSLLLSLLTGHVITSPSVSIFVALILNMFYNELYGEIRI